MNPLSADRIVRWRWIYAILFLALTGAAWLPSRELRFSRTMETMFPPGRPLMNAYQRLKRTFGGSDLLLFAYASPDFKERPREALDRLDVAGERLLEVQGVQSIVSLATIDASLNEKFGMSLASDSKQAREILKLLEGFTHDAGRSVFAIAVTLDREPARKEGALLPVQESRLNSRRETLLELRDVAKRLEAEGYEQVQIAGEPVMVIEGFRLVEQDGFRLAWFSGLLLMLALLVLFRSVRWAVLPLAVVFTATILTRAALSLSGVQLSMVSSMLTAIITVVGVATMVHVLVHFSGRRTEGQSREAAYIGAWGVLAAPVAWAVLTDVAAFSSLMLAEVGPVRDFGLMMAVGAAMVLPGAMFLAPAIALLPAWEERISPPRGASWGRTLRLSLAFIATLVGLACLLWGGLQTFGFIAGLDEAQFEPDPRFGYFATNDGFWTVQWIGAGAWVVAAWAWRWFRADPGREREGGILSKVLNGTLALTRYRLPALVATVAVLIFSVWGSLRMEIESDFTRNFRSDSELVRSYEFVESNLGGAGVWEIHLPAPEKLDADYLNRVRTLQDRLRREVRIGPDESLLAVEPIGDADEASEDEERQDEATDDSPPGEPGLTKVLSLVDAVDSFRAANPILFRIVPLPILLRQLQGSMPGLADQLHAPDPKSDPKQQYYRIMLRSLERQPSAVKQAIIERTRQIALEEFPEAENPEAPAVTGVYVLLAYLIESLIADQWLTFGVANAAIGIMLMIAFRSIRLALVCILPNVLPVMFVLAMMGTLGGKVNMGAAMIAAVSIGLTVDSSLHYVYSFLRARKATGSTSLGLAAAQQSVGSAATYSTIALVLGFGSLCGSSFMPTVYFGGLVCLAMLGGLVGNLFLLPALIRMVMPERASGFAESGAADRASGSPRVESEEDVRGEAGSKE
ncbi:MAG TPA: MMPL family transporter [Pirellulaceae bacterium]|jgi:predicted RND superfamily exporter protein|nr:MMPL family transporter [Pirellulaceae bacterium]